jgi:hypothetical protein
MRFIKLLIIFAFILKSNFGFTQSGFQTDQLFLGTGLNLGFFNGFIIGLNPELGYSLNKVVDAGISVNFNYITQNDPNLPISYRQTVYGGGPFLRLWPVNRFFLGGQYEFNTIAFSEKNNGRLENQVSYSSNSLLVGGGFGSRLIGDAQFFTSIMVDIMGDPKSPYVDRFNRQLPVFRTGFTFYFK